jgi:VWFA-related protein
MISLMQSPTARAQGSSIRVESFTLKPGGQVRIENARGSTSVEVWEGPVVRITAEKTSGAPIERTDMVLMSAQNTLLVQCRHGAAMGRIDLLVSIPRNSHLQIIGGGFPIDVSGSLASAIVESTTGNIEYRIPKTDDAQVIMRSKTGAVRSTVPLQVSQRTGGRGIDGKLGNGGPQIFLRSQSGNITLSPGSNSSAIASDLPSRDASSDDEAGQRKAVARRQNAPAASQQQDTSSDDDSDPNSIATPPSQRSTTSQQQGASGSAGTGGDIVSIGGSSNKGEAKGSQKIGPIQRQRDQMESRDSDMGMRIRIIPSNQPLGARQSNSPVYQDDDQQANPQSGQSQPNNRKKQDPIFDDPADQQTASRPKDTQPPPQIASADTKPTTPPVLKRRDEPEASPESPAAAAKTDSEAKTEDDEAIKLNSAVVNLTVSAMNRSGVAVANLKKEDFEVMENGQPQSVEFFQPSTAPFNLVLLLDLSGSIKDRLELVKAAALKFVDAVGKDDKVAVLTFTEEVKVVSQLTNNRGLLKERIKAIERPDGATALYEAMWFALVDTLRGTAGQRNAIVVMTDGVDSSIDRWNPAPTRVTFDRLARRLEESDAIVFPIYVDTEYDEAFRGSSSVAENYAMARLRLERMAELTGGTAYQAQVMTDLAGVYKQIAAALRTIYSVGYYPANTERDGTYRRVSVRVNRSDVAVRTRKGYWAK